MKRLIYFLAALFIVSCSTDGNVTGIEYPNVNLERGKPNGKGKGKPEKVALLSIPQDYSYTTQAITNIMLSPVEYTGELPVDDNGGLVDWDGDGLADDLIEYHWRCYFPRSFAWVTVAIDGENPQTINNSIAFGATLLGFADVDGNGTQDIIWEGGNNYLYNQGEVYSQYNVGYNVVAEEPTSLADLVSSLTLESTVNNPDYLRWDLGPEYEGMVFHVRVTRFEQLNDSTAQSTQTHTYGDWGLYAPSMFQGGGNFEVEFTNVNEDCSDVIVNVEL